MLLLLTQSIINGLVLQIQTGKEQFQNLNKMRFIKLLIFLVFVSCSSSASETYAESEALPFSIINEKILFIGNSFTFYWNLPSQVEKMSIERGLNWDVRHFTVPSATLKIHWNNPDLISLLESETFDHIIIQEH